MFFLFVSSNISSSNTVVENDNLKPSKMELMANEQHTQPVVYRWASHKFK